MDRAAPEAKWVDLYNSKMKTLPSDLLPASSGTPETSRRGTIAVSKKSTIEGLCLSHNPISVSVTSYTT